MRIARKNGLWMVAVATVTVAVATVAGFVGAGVPEQVLGAYPIDRHSVGVATVRTPTIRAEVPTCQFSITVGGTVYGFKGNLVNHPQDREYDYRRDVQKCMILKDGDSVAVSQRADGQMFWNSGAIRGKLD
ncbi:MAG: hypothetical protein HY457_00530 [Parcubacteria group bacterium]|nr:hypothetical protein [Parcubacteria group bacterium]